MNSSDTALSVLSASAPPASTGAPALGGLTGTEAARRLAQHGPNEVDERTVPAWRRLATRFWGPLPWMLEGTIVLTVLLGKDLEGGIIGVLLVLNSVIGFVQQSRSGDAL
ncbi:MAG TPA: cation-transporting P-type ATPase, partial [Acidimicrobiia bacterium]|nr:cation-transporting P-type ATPase [Acidimicrobiia bacterium]